MSASFGQFIGPITQLLGIAEGAAAGALPEVIGQLESAGLADQVRSWIAQGANSPVTPEELGRAFTPEQLHLLATQAGMSTDEVLFHLTRELPAAVHEAAKGSLDAPPPAA